MKKLLTIILLTGFINICSAQLVTNNIQIVLTLEQVNAIKTARILEGKTNQSVTVYASSIASEALVRKAQLINQESKREVYSYWKYLSDEQKKQILESAKAAKIAAETQ